MHNPASVLENGTHKLFWDFDIQRDPRISARQPDLVIIKKKKKEKKRTCKIVDFAVPDDHRVKLKEREKKGKYLDIDNIFQQAQAHLFWALFNGFKYFYQYQIILFCLLKVKWFQVLLCNSNNLASVICLHTFK